MAFKANTYSGADPGFPKGGGGDFCKERGGVNIYCLITKIYEPGACFLYISYVSYVKMTSHPFHHPLDPSLVLIR